MFKKNGLGGLIYKMFRYKHGINAIKKDPVRRPKSVKYGVISIIISIISIVLAVATGFIVGTTNSQSGFALVFLVFVALMVVIPAIYCMFAGLILSINQLSINKRAIGWVALGISILSIILDIVLVFLVANM